MSKMKQTGRKIKRNDYCDVCGLLLNDCSLRVCPKSKTQEVVICWRCCYHGSAKNGYKECSENYFDRTLSGCREFDRLKTLESKNKKSEKKNKANLENVAEMEQMGGLEY